MATFLLAVCMACKGGMVSIASDCLDDKKKLPRFLGSFLFVYRQKPYSLINFNCALRASCTTVKL